MNRLFCAVVVCVLLVGCSREANPLNPGGSNNTAAFHLAVDGITCRGLGAVALAIDGTIQGNVLPGDNGLTRTVSVGTHAVSANALTPRNWGYSYYDWPVTLQAVPAGGTSLTLYCR